MRVRAILLTLSIGLGFVGIYDSVETVSGGPIQRSANGSRPQSEFRYVIVKDSVDPVLPRRNIEVLLDESAFSEESLRTLFALISKRYRKPQWIYISVATNLRQIATPEERDLPNVSESNIVPEPDPYPRAIMFRQDGNQLFRYTPNPPSSKLKTVILKGKDPNP